MIEWSDKAIVLSTKKHGETSSIVSVFSEEQGIYKGLVRGIHSKKNRGIYDIGNIVTTTWKARLSEQLGFFQSELKIPTSVHLLKNKVKLTALVTLCRLLEVTLPERDAHPEAYQRSEYFLHQLLSNSSIWIIHYILLEIEMLSYLGFRLELHQCGDTQNTDELIYVSPKTGRAICKTSGAPYKDKLLPLPPNLSQLIQLQLSEITDNFIFTTDDIRKSLALTGFFLNKCLTSHYRTHVPNIRNQLVGYLCKDVIA